MRAVTFSAWRTTELGKEPILLSEVVPIVTCGRGDLRWRLDVEWANAHPNACVVENFPGERLITTAELLDLVPSGMQIVDGYFEAVLPGCDEPSIRLVAFDSTSWDVYSDDSQVLVDIRARYPDVQELAE